MAIKSLLTEISPAHFPHPSATAARIAAFETRMGWRLDDDLRAFCLHCDGAELFKKLPDANYSILSLEGIEAAAPRLRQRAQGASETASLYPLVDCQDSDFVLVSVAHPGGPYPLFDACHEKIAGSFGSFLEQD